MSFDPPAIKAAIEHLQRNDAVMKDLIGRVGEFRLRLRRRRFDALVHAIIAQQISGRAATSIYNRLCESIKPAAIAAGSILAMSPAQLNAAGISPQKSRYLLDLAVKWSDRSIRHRRFSSMSDVQVIEELIQVKGIGRWTAQMFLIFSLGRLDVFSPDDLGLRTAIRNLYGLAELPDRTTSETIAQPWRPYSTIASWYCWRSLELKD